MAALALRAIFWGCLLSTPKAEDLSFVSDEDLEVRNAMLDAWDNLDTLYDTYSFSDTTNMTVSTAAGKVTVRKGDIKWTLGSSPLIASRAFETLKTASENTARKHKKLKARQASRRLVGGEFFVLPNVMTKEEAAEMRSLLPDDFDMDPDSVDGGATHEFYLEKHGVVDNLMETLPGKPDADPETHAKRLPRRRKLAEIARPIVSERILPFVRSHYVLPPPPTAQAQALGMSGHREHVGGTSGCGFHGCEVCWSFVRRYREGERRSHEMHFDQHALVTVVVSLSSAGSDFEGGIYLSTGKRDGRRQHTLRRTRDGRTIRAARHFLPLQTGDALIHQSDLLHGVHVTKGERWSWVLWLKDRQVPKDFKGKPMDHPFGGCTGLTSHWSKVSARHGDPVAMFLTARRLHAEALIKAKSEFPATRNEAEGMMGKRLKLLKGSAEKGFTRSFNEYGIAAYEFAQESADRWDTHIDQLMRDARIYFEAGAYYDEADALYNLGKFYLEQGYTKYLRPADAYVKKAKGAQKPPSDSNKEMNVDGVREAVLLFARAAGEGSTLAMFNLGVAYLKGAAGLPKSLKEARKWFERCGTPEALHALATTYKEDYEKTAAKEYLHLDGDHAYVKALRRAAAWGSHEARKKLVTIDGSRRAQMRSIDEL